MAMVFVAWVTITSATLKHDFVGNPLLNLFACLNKLLYCIIIVHHSWIDNIYVELLNYEFAYNICYFQNLGGVQNLTLREHNYFGFRITPLH